jgi:hypothetical protein
MKKFELKQGIIERFIEFIESNNFITLNNQASFIEFTTYNNSKGIIINIQDYAPKYYLSYYVYAIDHNITNFMSELGSKIQSGLVYSESEHTFTASYKSVNNLNRVTYLPPIQNEGDLNTNIKEIQSYLESTLFPMLEKYEDLTELHKAINGEDFWETDWRKPFTLGGNFEYKRLIVAHLADISDEEFDQVVEKQRTIITEKTKGEYGEDFKKVLEIQNELVRLLKA